MQHAALASTQSSASWSGLSVLGVIDLARWGPMACMATQNVSMAPGAAPPGSWADRIVCHSAARAHGWQYCLVREGIECRLFELPSLHVLQILSLLFTPLACCRETVAQRLLHRRLRSCCRRSFSLNKLLLASRMAPGHRLTRAESALCPCPCLQSFLRRRVLCRARSSGWGPA